MTVVHLPVKIEGNRIAFVHLHDIYSDDYQNYVDSRVFICDSDILLGSINSNTIIQNNHAIKTRKILTTLYKKDEDSISFIMSDSIKFKNKPKDYKLVSQDILNPNKKGNTIFLTLDFELRLFEQNLTPKIYRGNIIVLLIKTSNHNLFNIDLGSDSTQVRYKGNKCSSFRQIDLIDSFKKEYNDNTDKRGYPNKSETNKMFCQSDADNSFFYKTGAISLLSDKKSLKNLQTSFNSDSDFINFLTSNDELRLSSASLTPPPVFIANEDKYKTKLPNVKVVLTTPIHEFDSIVYKNSRIDIEERSLGNESYVISLYCELYKQLILQSLKRAGKNISGGYASVLLLMPNVYNQKTIDKVLYRLNNEFNKNTILYKKYPQNKRKLKQIQNEITTLQNKKEETELNLESISELEAELEKLLSEISRFEQKNDNVNNELSNLNMLLDIQVISESDAVYLGLQNLNVATSNNKTFIDILSKNNLSRDKIEYYTIIDSGKGTTDFSIIKPHGKDSGLTSIHRGGIVGAGSEIDFVFFQVFSFFLHKVLASDPARSGATYTHSVEGFYERMKKVYTLLPLIQNIKLTKVIEKMKKDYNINSNKTCNLLSSIIDKNKSELMKLINENDEKRINFEIISGAIEIINNESTPELEIDEFDNFYNDKKILKTCNRIAKEIIDKIDIKFFTTHNAFIFTGRSFLFAPLKNAFIEKIVEKMKENEKKISRGWRLLNSKEKKPNIIKLGIGSEKMKSVAVSFYNPKNININARSTLCNMYFTDYFVQRKIEIKPKSFIEGFTLKPNRANGEGVEHKCYYVGYVSEQDENSQSFIPDNLQMFPPNNEHIVKRTLFPDINAN